MLSYDNKGTTSKSGTPYSSPGLKLVSLDANMSLNCRLPMWREQQRKN